MNTSYSRTKSLLIALILTFSCILTGFAPNKSRQEIVVATDDIRQIRSIIRRFNNENNSYYVTIKELDGSSTREGLTAIANSSEGADIAVIYVEPPIGLPSEGFENLLPNLTKDETEGMDALLPSVLVSMTKDESVYWVCPSFMIHTYTADADVVGDRTTISLTEARNYATSLGENYKVFESWRGRGNLMNDLTYVADLCSEADYEATVEELEYYPESVNESDTPYLLRYSPLWNAQSIGSLYHDWDGNYSYTGYPVSTGNGSYFEGAGANYAIFESSDNKAGAWEFIKFALEFEDEDNHFSIIQSKFDGALQDALENNAVRREDVDKFLALMGVITEYKQ